LIYFDTTYIGRLYFQDDGWEAVRKLAASNEVACALHGRSEAIGIFHRKLREQAISLGTLAALIDEFEADCTKGGIRWLPLSDVMFDRVSSVYKSLPAAVHLRAADALHLACAAENGFPKIYSNDRRLLEAASYFGVQGENVI
jgi:predicted nucleic acid-binding protein